MVCALCLALPATAQTLRVERAAIMDATGMERPMPAFTMMVPKGWQTQGGVVWGGLDHCNRYGYNFNWQATSADGSQGVMILPQIYWSTQPNPIPGTQSFCLQTSFAGVRPLIEWMLASFVPGARVIDYRARPDILKEAGLQSGRMDFGSYAITTQADAGEALVAYAENGREMRATIAIAISAWTTEIPGMAGIPGIRMSGGMSLPGYAAFAPAGQLDLRIAEMIRKSSTANPEWMRRILDHQRKINSANNRAAMDRSRITAQTNSEISDIIHQGYRDRSAIQDRGQRETTEMIRGVETYNDPYNGGSVQLDNTYERAWQLEDGSFVLTNDQMWQPGQNLGMNGTLLTPLE